MLATDFYPGVSTTFQALLNQSDAYAESPWPVVILGETGVGKELLARRIHDRSPRRRNVFIPINCGAMPPGLFESELFGYERGAFSGATQSHRGLLRSAQGGSVFFDEIGDLPMSLQVKLLRFLDSNEVRSVGSTRTERIDVRIIAATNVNLHRAAQGGQFRSDLLERLSVLTLRVPPLRDRREDIAPLAKIIFEAIGGTWDEGVTPVLRDYEWPGNIRQLKNVLARAYLLTRGKINRTMLEHLLREEIAHNLPALFGGGFEGSLADIEKKIIVSKLKSCHGNRKKTAEELGIAKSTLHEKLKKWKAELGDEADWPIARFPDYPALSRF